MTAEFVYKMLSDCIEEVEIPLIDEKDAFATLMYIDGLNTVARTIAAGIEKEQEERDNCMKKEMQKLRGTLCFADNGDDIEALLEKMAERETECEKCNACANGGGCKK